MDNNIVREFRKPKLSVNYFGKYKNNLELRYSHILLEIYDLFKNKLLLISSFVK